jgi:CO/xanthine dehydrogenase Mo-binding subunit
MNARQGFVGQSVERREDARFLTGQGQYTDDITLPGQTYAAFLRSPHAHARIKSLDTTAAAKAPGVVGIFTGEHFKAVGGLPCGWLINSLDGTPMKEPKHPVLADGKVRYVGDRVAMVVAETVEQARAAASLIDVDYEVLTPVVDTARAFGAGSAVHDEAPDNQCYHWGIGDKAGVDAAFAQAAHVTTLKFRNNRLIPNAIEPRAANASYSAHDDSYTLYVANQNPHVERLLMCAFVLGIPEHKMRVVAPDVGGGFGSKIYLYGEETAMVWASKQLKPSAARASCPTPTAATTSAQPSSRSTRTATSWRCAPTPRPTWAPTCPRSRAASPPSCTPRCWRASTRRPRSGARSRRCSPTPRRWTPTAAPAGPRPPTCSSASSRRQPPRWGSTRRRFAAATSSRSSPTPPRWA